MLSSVHRLYSIERLPEAIRDSLKKKVNLLELNEYVDTVLTNTFEFDYHNYTLDFGEQFYFGSFLVDVEIDEEQIQIFIEKHNSLLEKLAYEHIKKINQYKKMDKQ